MDGSATDVSDTNPLPIDDAGGSLTVDGTITANLGSTDNAVLDAIAASLVDVETNTDSGAVVGGGTEAAALRVTLANDSTGLVSVDDGGGALTVDGTVTANLSATDNAVLDTIDAVLDNILVDTTAILADTANMDTNLGTVAGAVSGSEMQVDIVSSAAIPITDNAGSLTVDGTVTANLSATDNAVLDTIDAVLDTINAKLVTGTVIGDVNLGATDNAVLDAIAADTSTLTTGVSAFSSIDLDESEEEIKGSAGTLYSIYAWNATAAPLWLQIFNATAASVTVGSTAPTYNFPIPANADSDVAGVVIQIPEKGIAFSTAITMAATTGSGTNSGAPGANEAGVFVTYS